MGSLTLVRHGQTEWSKTGQHTGVTDLPLTDAGMEQARALGAALAGHSFALVLTSPRRRARDTAALARLAPAAVDDDLAEWDYGGYEGRTTAQISADLGRPWTLFADGVVAGDTPGETLDQVAARATAVLDRIRPVLTTGDVALVGHGHLLRVLATVWLQWPAVEAAKLLLAAGTISRLTTEHGVPAIDRWSCDPGHPA